MCQLKSTLEHFDCRTKLQNQEALMEQIERERTENSELKIKVHHVETEYNSYISSERVSAENNRCNHQWWSIQTGLKRD